MKKNKRLFMRSIVLALLAAALGYTIYANFFTSKEKISIGDKAPDFILTDLNGQKHQLSDYRGKGVFLNFWGTWCKPCEREMPYMDHQYQLYKHQGVEILAVNVGEPKLVVEEFVEKYQLSFPVLIDNKDQVLHTYGVDPLPTSFLIDKDGKVIDILTGQMTEKDVKKYMEMIKP